MNRLQRWQRRWIAAVIMGLAMTLVPIGAVITAQPVQPDSQNHRDHRSGYHGSGSAAKAGGVKAKELPKTGGTVGASLLAVGAGTLLVGGGLLARRIGSSHRSGYHGYGKQKSSGAKHINHKD